MTTPGPNVPGSRGVPAQPSQDVAAPLTATPTPTPPPASSVAGLAFFGSRGYPGSPEGLSGVAYTPMQASGVATQAAQQTGAGMTASALLGDSLSASLKETTSAINDLIKEIKDNTQTTKQSSRSARHATSRPGATGGSQERGTPESTIAGGHTVTRSGTESKPAAPATETPMTPVDYLKAYGSLPPDQVPTAARGPLAEARKAIPGTLPTTAGGETYEPINANEFTFSSAAQQFSNPSQIGRFVASKLHSVIGRSRLGVPNITKVGEGQYMDNASGSMLDPSNADHASTINSYETRMAGRTRILGGLEAAATGQGTLSSTLVGGLTEHAGELGIAVGATKYAVDKVGSTLVQQRAEGQGYQQAEGVGTGAALTERAHEKLFAWSQYGTMSGQQAGELFQGVSDILPSGTGRQNALDFATNQLKSYGMSISDSLGLINTAVKSGIDNFSNLGDSITAVSNAAKTAGTNVQAAQQAFAQNYSQAAQTIGGQGALSAATNVSVAQAALVPSLSGISLGGLNSDQSLYMMAAQQGKTITQLIGESQGPNGALSTAQGQQALLNQYISDSASPSAIDAIQNQIKQAAGTGGSINQSQIEAIARQAETSNSVNVNQIIGMATAAGVTGVTTGNAAQWLVQQLANRNSIAGPAEARQTAMGQDLKDVASGTIGGQKVASKTAQGVRGANGQFTSVSPQAQVLANQILGAGSSGAKSFSSQADKSGTTANVIEQYYQHLQGGGSRDAVIEQLIGSGDAGDQFRVQTKSGGRTVSLEQGIKDYTGQFYHGTATFASGADAGSTVGSVVKGAVKGTAGSATQKARSGSKSSDSGQSGKVEISLQPGIASLFKFATSGGAYLSVAQQAGVPADAFPPTDDLVTGGGG